MAYTPTHLEEQKLPKVGEPISGTNLTFEKADIANLQTGGQPIISTSADAQKAVDTDLKDLKEAQQQFTTQGIAEPSSTLKQTSIQQAQAPAKPQPLTLFDPKTGREATFDTPDINKQNIQGFLDQGFIAKAGALPEGLTQKPIETTVQTPQKKQETDLAQVTKEQQDLATKQQQQIEEARIGLSAVTQRYIDSIKQELEVRKRQQEEINRGLVGATRQFGFTMNLAQSAPLQFAGLIHQQESIGIQRISEITATYNKAINEAELASKTKDWELLNKSMELARTAAEAKTKSVIDFAELVRKNNQLLVDKFKAETNRIKTLGEDSEKIVKSIGYLALNSITGNAEQDLETIKTLSTQYKIDPNKLYSEILRLQQEKVKYPAGIIGEYQFYVDNALANGVPQDKILDFQAYQTFDANRKAIASGMNGLTPKDTQNFLTITNKFQADEIIKNGDKANATITIANQVLVAPEKATNQLKALYILVKGLDPESAVREGELALAEKAQSYLGRFQTNLQRIFEGKILDSKTTKELAIATKELASAWQESAKLRSQRYRAQAKVAGIGNAFEDYLASSQLQEKQAENVVTAPDGTQIIITD